jgi:predicted GNAT superfamily acetyltransferase
VADTNLQSDDAVSSRPADSVGSPISPATLGFQPVASSATPNGETLAWTKRVGDLAFTFRVLRTLAELQPTEPLQREVFGVSDIDLIPPNALTGAFDTGGDVIGVFPATAGAAELAGYCVSYGGYYRRRPRLLSDFLVVRKEMRAFGLGTEIKKLQAAIALERGFVEIVWTVDPLRAANARLNFEKLGAISNQYEINRYGESFGTGLYGGMPTDRLHVSWQIGSERVRDRLLARTRPLSPSDVEDLIHFDPDKPQAERALIHVPNDIDELLAADANAALRWRLSLRETLPLAFANGFVVTGFVPNTVPERKLSSLVLSKHATATNDR